MVSANVKKIIATVPANVDVVVATKGRSIPQIQEVIAAGITIIGENYVQEAEEKFAVIGNNVAWHLLGHLQKNKVKRAVKLFDVIQTIDSFEIAALIDKECSKISKVMPVLIEVNSGREQQKSGVFPEEVTQLIERLFTLRHIAVTGLMTMGPLLDDAECIRPYFQATKRLFDALGVTYKDRLDWKHLSMGMSLSYTVAIQEGATMVRLGTIIFESST